MFVSVLLPAPFSPRSACTSPRLRSKSTWSLARTPGNDFTMPRASMAGGRSAGVDGVIVGVGKRRGPRAAARGPRPPRLAAAQGGERDRDVLVPPVHADRALRARGSGRELVEVGLLQLLAGREQLLAGVVLDRPGEDVEPAELTGEHLREGLLDVLDVRFRKVAQSLLRRLTLHEAVQAHRLRVGV